MGERGRDRVVILSDAANEADDQFAIAHALLTPSLDVRGVIAQHFGREGSARLSYEEVVRVVRLARREDVPVALGAPRELGSCVSEGLSSPGADLLVGEALADERPLYALCMGPLTDVALALRACPAMAGRMTVVWVGGGRYPAGGHEANLARDLLAAREVLASDVALWQIPSEAYKGLVVPISQLYVDVRPCGELGHYLYRELVEFRDRNLGRASWVRPESWVLGDQAAVGVLLADMKGCYEEMGAPSLGDDLRYGPPPRGDRRIRVYHRLNDRLIIDDLLAKLRIHAMEG